MTPTYLDLYLLSSRGEDGEHAGSESLPGAKCPVHGPGCHGLRTEALRRWGQRESALRRAVYVRVGHVGNVERRSAEVQSEHRGQIVHVFRHLLGYMSAS